jgi:hypothetical protein
MVRLAAPQRSRRARIRGVLRGVHAAAVGAKLW